MVTDFEPSDTSPNMQVHVYCIPKSGCNNMCDPETKPLGQWATMDTMLTLVRSASCCVSPKSLGVSLPSRKCVGGVCALRQRRRHPEAERRPGRHRLLALRGNGRHHRQLPGRGGGHQTGWRLPARPRHLHLEAQQGQRPPSFQLSLEDFTVWFVLIDTHTVSLSAFLDAFVFDSSETRVLDLQLLPYSQTDSGSDLIQ